MLGSMPLIAEYKTVPVSARTHAPTEVDRDDPLATIMREMSSVLEADGVLVAWHDGDHEPVLLFADGECTADHMVEPQPAMAGLTARPVTEWHLLEELAPGGCMTTRLPAGGGTITITSLFRKVGETTRSRVRDAAGRLLPMIGPFFRLWSAQSRALSRLRGLTAAINKSDVGVYLIDHEGHLTFANAAAEALVAENDGLRRSGRMLSATRLADTLRLHAAIEHVVATGGSGGGAAPVVALSRKSRRPLLAAVVASEAEPDQRQDSAAIIYVFDPERDLSSFVEPACKLYGLSPVETRLTCLLTEGMTLADAATRMRVREQSARSYLKQIFLKTETNRQAELVWLMLKSSVRTAPGCLARLV